MRKTLVTIYQVLCIVLLVAELAEFFFAGLGVFHATNFQIHRYTGGYIWYGTILLFLLSLVSKMGGKTIWLSFLLFLLMMLQGILVNIHQPFVAALHPLNGIAILVTTFVLWRRAKRLLSGRMNEA